MIIHVLLRCHPVIISSHRTKVIILEHECRDRCPPPPPTPWKTEAPIQFPFLRCANIWLHSRTLVQLSLAHMWFEWLSVKLVFD